MLGVGYLRFVAVRTLPTRRWTTMPLRAVSGAPPPENTATADLLEFYEMDVVWLRCVYPRVLRYDPARIRATIATLKALDVDHAKALRRWPFLWGIDPSRWEERVAVLRPLEVDVGKVVTASPSILARPPAYLQTKLEMLSRIGLNAPKIVRRCPTVFSYSDHRIGNTIAFLDGAGLDGIRIVNGFPSVLCCSIENKLRPIVNFVTSTMRRDVTELHNYPACFGLSLTGRLVPRYEFAALHNRHHLALGTLFGFGDEPFVKWMGQPHAAYKDFVSRRMRD